MDKIMLENYIGRYGWMYERHDEVVVAGLETPSGNCLVVFQLSSPWLRLNIPALAPGKDRSAAFYADLLSLNDSSRMARYGLGEDGHVALYIDLYTEPELPYTQFEIAVDVLGYVAEKTLASLISTEGLTNDVEGGSHESI